MKKIILLSLIAGTAFVPQQANAVNWKNLIIGGTVGAGIVYSGYKFYKSYNPTPEELNAQLLSAAYDNNLKKIKWCLDNGADIEAQDHSGRTLLLWASYNGHLETVKLLIDKGANIEAKDDYGYTPLIRASYKGHLETVKYLIEMGADIEAQDMHDNNPLIHASYNGHLEIVKYLIDKGANPLAQCKYKQTAYDYALQKNHTEIVQYLLNVQNELTNFKNNPTKWTVAAPKIPNAPKHALLKMTYKGDTYFIDTNFIFTAFDKAGENKELKKILEECEFLRCNKKELKKLRKIGFPITPNEFDMKENVVMYQKNNTFTDLFIE